MFGNDFPGFYKNNGAKGYLWDELAAAYLLDPAVVTKAETKHLDVVTTFGPEYGKVVEHHAAGATPVEIRLAPNAQRALDLYVRLLRE